MATAPARVAARRAKRRRRVACFLDLHAWRDLPTFETLDDSRPAPDCACVDCGAWRLCPASLNAGFDGDLHVLLDVYDEDENDYFGADPASPVPTCA